MKKYFKSVGRLTVYQDTRIFVYYILLCFLKAFFQILDLKEFQVFLLLILNYFLLKPFQRKGVFDQNTKYKLYFGLVFLGQATIIYYNNLFFLKLGTAFFILSKITILFILDHHHSDIRLLTKSDYLKILGPQIVSFSLAYLFYNHGSLDTEMAILIIVMAELEALLATFILYLNNLKKNHIYIKLGVILIMLHDSFGGLNFYNTQLDKYFIISILLISIGNFLLGLGFWRSRSAFNKRLQYPMPISMIREID